MSKDKIGLYPWVAAELRCPLSGSRLVMVEVAGGMELHTVDASPALAYPVTGGVPVLLPSEARPL